ACIEIILRSGHVPFRLESSIRRRAARRSAWTRLRLLCVASAAPSGSLIGRNDPTAILHTAIDIPGTLHFQFQFEIGGFATLPHEINRPRRLFACGLDNNRAVFHFPIVVAGPAIQCFAIKQRNPTGVLIEVDGIGLAESPATSASAAPRSLLRRGCRST